MEIFDYQIIANLTSGDGKIEKKLEEVKLFLENHQLSYRLIKIESYFPIDDIFEKEKFVIKKGVICLGGDGTVSSAISYMLNNQIEAPIGIVPVGTANFIASYLKLDCDCRNFDCFLKERVKFFDVGVAEFGKHREYFILGLGLGFERDLLHLPQKLKKKVGIFSYILNAISKLVSLEKTSLDLEMDGKFFQKEVCLLTILNLHPKILRIFPIFKDKRIKSDDGILNLYLVEYRNYLYAFLGTLIFHFLGKNNFGLVKSYLVKNLTVSSNKEIGCQIDGELKGKLPVKISVLNKKVGFFVP